MVNEGMIRTEFILNQYLRSFDCIMLLFNMSVVSIMLLYCADLVYIKLIMEILNMIIMSYRLHKSHSTEPIHHVRPTYRPGGWHRWDIYAWLIWRGAVGKTGVS